MNRTIVLALVFVSLTAYCVIAIRPVKANSKTITVPDDYPTIAAAITNAAAGDIVFVRSGTYQEYSLLINKTLTLVGENKNSTIIRDIDPPLLSSNWPPINSATIRVAASSIKISGFTLTGGSDGVAGRGDKIQIIDNIIIAERGRLNLEGSNQNITQNTIKNIPKPPYTYSGWGIHVKGSCNSITTNNISGASIDGITIEAGGYFNLVYGNTLTDTGGIIVKGDGNIIAKNNITREGISVDGGSNNIVYVNSLTEGGITAGMGYNNTFFANQIANAQTGALVGSDVYTVTLSGNNTFYHNNFIDNMHQVSLYGRMSNYFDNGREGNFWSDYKGMDANGDGIGDAPYVISGNVTDRYPLMVPFDISTVTVQLPDWATSTLSPAPSQTPTISESPKLTPTPPLTTSSPPVTQQPSPSNSPPPTGDNSGLQPDAYWIALAAVGAVSVIVVASAFALRKRSFKKQRRA